jgi:hypothetical protein
MEAIGAAASILAIAGAGIQISIKLVTLASQIQTAPKRIRAIGDDISLTSGILQQLAELMKESSTHQERGASIFSDSGLRTTRACASTCERLFQDVEHEMRHASKQISTRGFDAGAKVVLTKTERLTWPFLQPSMDNVRNELREAKATLMLVLQVTTLAYHTKIAEQYAGSSSGRLSGEEQQALIRAIVAYREEHGTQEGTVTASPLLAQNMPPSGVVSMGKDFIDFREERSKGASETEKIDTEISLSLETFIKDEGQPELPQVSSDINALETVDRDKKVRKTDVFQPLAETPLVERRDTPLHIQSSISAEAPFAERSISERSSPIAIVEEEGGLNWYSRGRPRAKFRFSNIFPHRREDNIAEEVVYITNLGAWDFEPELDLQLKCHSESGSVVNRIDLYFRVVMLKLSGSEILRELRAWEKKDTRTPWQQWDALTPSEKKGIQSSMEYEDIETILGIRCDKPCAPLPSSPKTKIRNITIIARKKKEEVNRVREDKSLMKLGRLPEDARLAEIERGRQERAVQEHIQNKAKWKGDKEESDRLFEERVKAKFNAAGYSEEEATGAVRKKMDRRPTETLDWAKPTFVKVHRKYMLPETLEAYNIPWEWDEVISDNVFCVRHLLTVNLGLQRDSNYIIIKRSFKQDFLDELFEHTKKIKERKLISYESPEKYTDRMYLVRKESPKLGRRVVPRIWIPKKGHQDPQAANTEKHPSAATGGDTNEDRTVPDVEEIFDSDMESIDSDIPSESALEALKPAHIYDRMAQAVEEDRKAGEKEKGSEKKVADGPGVPGQDGKIDPNMIVNDLLAEFTTLPARTVSASWIFT